MLKIDNIIQKFKDTPSKKDKDIVGIVKKINHKFGFLKSKNKLNYFIPEKYINRVMNGDKILVTVFNKNNKTFVKPLRLIKQFLNNFIGNIKKIGEKFFIQPNYPFLKELIFCNINDIKTHTIKHGDWCYAKLLHHKLNDLKEFHVKLTKFISSNENKFLPWKVILSHYNIEYKFPKTSYDINFDNNISRKDLTHLNFITIDDKNTQDIDDAFFLQKYTNNSIKIIIAIADPTSFISPGSELDKLASQRLFTNYLPGLNIPMLPEQFSEDIFSLQPYKKRPVLACEVIVDQFGEISEHVNFFFAWIKSYAKLNYINVSHWIQGLEIWKPYTSAIANQLNLLNHLCYIRILWRTKYALILKDHPEYKFHFSKNQDIIKISIECRNIAHKMVEEVMIIANVTAAKFLSKNLGFGIYNVHSGFSLHNANYISLMLKTYHINVNAKKIVNLIGFCDLYRKLNHINNCYINNRIQKYQSFGTFSITPKPHFALGFNEYLTWTSPIRKYSDMINHRLLKNVILGYPSIKPSHNTLLNIINCKRLHKTVKNNIENWLYVEYFNKHNKINKIFQATIFDILPYGIKARILINGAKIFIPIIYIHHIRKELLCDQRNGILYLKNKEIYRVTNIITVIIVKLKIEERIIIAKPYYV